MAPNPSAALRLALAAALFGALPAEAVTPAEARSLDYSSIFSPAQSVMIRALNSDKAFLDAFYPEFEKASADQAAGKTAEVQAYAEKWRLVINKRAGELLAQDPSDRALFPPTELKGLERQVFDVIYLEGDVQAHTAAVPKRRLGTPEGDPLRDVEIIARNRVAIRRFLGYVVSQPGGALGSAEKDWEALRAAMTESNKPGTLDDVRGWLAASAPKSAPAAATPEPKKADFERVFGKELGAGQHARFQEELKRLDPKAPDHEAARRRLVEEWQGRLNKGPLEARIALVFQSPVERAAASYLAKSWAGKTGEEAEAAFSEDLDKALRGDAAARSAIVGAARKAVAEHLKKDSDPPGFKEHLSGKGVTRDSLLAFYCAVGEAAPAAPERGAAGARDQARAADARAAGARTGDEDGARAADFTHKETGAAPGVPPAPPAGDAIDPALAEECGKWKAADVARRENAAEAERRRAAARSGAAPDIAGEAVGKPPTTPDAETPSTAAADAKKKKDLQRAAIGGLGGALVLGVFGFIFGGPIGALAMGAIGFGVMAGVSYLNNNPIE